MVPIRAGGLRRIRAKLIYLKIWRKYGCCIYPYAKVGVGFHIAHPVGLVIGCCEIGENFTIFQNCTIGVRDENGEARGLTPTIGSGVTMFAGSMVLGKVNVSDGCVIGANSVVIRDCPIAGSYVGSPAKLVVGRQP